MGLDIAMHDAFSVDVLEPHQQLPEDIFYNFVLQLASVLQYLL